MSRAIALVLLASAGGCYLPASAVRNPVPSPDGVAITLLGQDCEDHEGLKGEPISRDLGVKVRIDNSSGRTLRVSEETIHLFVDGYAGAVLHPEVVEVPAHQSTTLTLGFIHHAACEQNQKFVVAWNHAFSIDQRRLALQNLTFSP